MTAGLVAGGASQAGASDDLVDGGTPPAPEEKLSPGFQRLFVAAIASNMADGVGRVAIPLLAAVVTRDPLAMAFLGALGIVPWLAFGVYSGLVVDRVDRRKAMAAANVLRLAAAGLLAAAILSDHVSIPLLAVVVLVFGTGETFFDNATNAVIPSVVPVALRDKANSRIQAAQGAVDLFVATPLGSAMFAAAAVLPVAVAGGGYGLAAALALALPAVAARSLRGSREVGVATAAEVAVGLAGDLPADSPVDVDASATAEPAPTAMEGVRFLWSHTYLRRMTLMTSLVAALLSFAQATSVLLFLDRYHVAPALLGLVTSGIGVGAVGGSLLAPTLVARWGKGRVMLGAMVAGGVGLGAVALSPNVWVAAVAYGFGAGGVSMWNVPWASARQSLVPGHLMGRVVGFARTIAWSLIPIATVVGGLVGRISLQLSFAIGGIGVVALAVVGARLVLSTDRQAPVEE